MKKLITDITFTQNEIVDMIVEKLQIHAGIVKKSTYNISDPTHYEIFTAKLFLQYGFTFSDLTHCCPPNAENVKVKVHDMTWGVRFTIQTSIGKLEGYWSRNFSKKNYGSWCCNTTQEFINTLKTIFLKGEKYQESFDKEEVDYDDDGDVTITNSEQEK